MENRHDGAQPGTRARAQRRLGASGEEAAAHYLATLGWIITARNVRQGRDEIDIIARDGDTCVFVEVKVRSSAHFGDGAEAVTAAKLARLRRAATSWLRAEGAALPVRFDVLSALHSADGTWDFTHYRGVDDGAC